MKRPIPFLALVAALALSACGTTIQAQVQSFTAGEQIAPGETVFVLPGVPPQQQTLETQSWVALAQQEFRKRGYIVTNDPNRATLKAAISLGIDNGRDVTSTFAVPQFGVTGYSGAQTFGTMNSFGNTATYSSNTTLTPQYGVTGYIPGSRTDRVFGRTGMLVMARFDPAGNMRVVFDSRIRSNGSCGNLAVIAPELVQALFSKFPAGGAGAVELPMAGQC
ncbi:hypothetical protein BSA145_21360 (plasmid) [Bacillus safensis]|uniref:DUF4136 domain-containing protein n=1 Tax=Bacillus safensis TaxID=561879 RepID=A0A1L6ZPG8_BACIA|nr:DUF4136 domain-containing protein [Bacillus safensis]APT48416.1 hypothetical protein BSA145_21360 [Bacillus safensis]